MSSIEIMEVQAFPAAGTPVAAFAIDAPASGDASESDGFVLAGWILGRSAPVQAVTVTEAGRPLTELTVGGQRNDVAAAYPDAIGANASGFQGWVPAVALGPTFRLDLHAVFATGEHVELGMVSGRRQRSAGDAGGPRPAHLTSSSRGLPDFVIIGAQRGGTRSLYEYLSGHRRIEPARTDEVHFFSLFFDRGLSWYQQQFPPRAADQLTGEASPYYLFHPLAARRLHAVLPDARLLVLLRNPVERAFSHYQLEVRQGSEPLSFEEAIAAEEDRLAGEEERLLADDTYISFAHQHHSYLARGRYAEQLGRWLALFPRDQLLILKSEDFYDDPAAGYDRATAFLGLPPAPLTNTRVYNRSPADTMSAETRRRLRAYFAAENAGLSEIVGFEIGWDEPDSRE